MSSSWSYGHKIAPICRKSSKLVLMASELERLGMYSMALPTSMSSLQYAVRVLQLWQAATSQTIMQPPACRSIYISMTGLCKALRRKPLGQLTQG